MVAYWNEYVVVWLLGLIWASKVTPAECARVALSLSTVGLTPKVVSACADPSVVPNVLVANRQNVYFGLGCGAVMGAGSSTVIAPLAGVPPLFGRVVMLPVPVQLPPVL